MNKIYKGKASWYGAEGENLNKHVALMGSVKCPDCDGKGYINTDKVIVGWRPCIRCSSDGKLTNPMLFNPNLMEGAICERLKDKVPMGSVVKITWDFIYYVYIRITDWGIPENKEKLNDRIIDLTRGSFIELTGNINLGIVDIEMEVL